MDTVAIIGRPNVGKSTLFNMLVGRRLAITHEQAGVTRDIKKEVITHHNTQITLVDTGGITEDGQFSNEVSALSYHALEDADVVILLVSAEEITAEDEELISGMRKIKKPLLFVVNKVDNEEREWTSSEYYKYGIGDPIMISALHRRNEEMLWDTIMHALHKEVKDDALDEDDDDDVLVSEDDEEQDSSSTHEGEGSEPRYKKKGKIRLLIMGKPNTGKSSVLNALLGKERVLVSDIPGTTRDIIEEEVTAFGESFILVDSAGIRKKNRIYDDVEYYSSHRAISAIASSDVILLMIDVMDGLSEQDKKIASLIINRGKGLVICLNKWDLIEVKKNRLVAEKDRLSYMLPQLHFVPVCPLSAKERSGFSGIIKEVRKVYDQLYMEINTSLLNRHLQQWILKNPPVYMRRRQGKLKFISQTSTNPIIFQVRVNNPDFLSDSYKQYIINSIRATHKIKNIPIRVDFIPNQTRE